MKMEIYKDSTAGVEERVKDVMSRMTLQEKIAQMTQIERKVTSQTTLSELSIGSVLNGGGSAPRENATAEEWAEMVDEFQKWALSSRLGIPILYATDAVHGNSNVVGATIFPHNVSLGATRDAELVRKIGAATALEVRGTGIHCAFAPCVAVCKDSRWGRCYESYSEDTEVVCKMSSLVTGLQGSPPEGHPTGYPFLADKKTNVIACAKHFVGDGGTQGGVNEGNTVCSFEELEKIHMKPYLNCLDQGVCTIMASYSSWNGTRMHTSHDLINGILKEKLNFKGFVISDWEALDRLSDPYGSNYRACISTCINAGIDMVMVPFRYNLFLEDLTSLVESGEVSMARIDDAVERILRVKFLAGLFEHPFSDRSLLKFVGCQDHRDLAREAVRKSLVLLKNGKDASKPMLPLDRNAKKVLVAGSHADDIGYQCGGWTIEWFGSKGPITKGTTILDGIKASVGNNTEVIYSEEPSEATLAGQEFDYAIVVVGEEPYAEFKGDRKELDIPFNGEAVIKFVANKIPTLAIVVSGRPLTLPLEIHENVEAIVAAWLPGSEGGGVAEVIFGDNYEFEGVLPVTWFRHISQLSSVAGHGNPLPDPLFPLGFGLKMGKK